VALAGALALAACSASDGATPAAEGAAAGRDAPSVLATTSIWADVVSNLACGGMADVDTLVPPGGDAHAFEPSLADRERLEGASLVVANGLGLEGGLDATLEAVEATDTSVFRVGEHVRSGDHEGGAGEEGDPHVWFDPLLVADALPALAEALASEVGLDPGAVDACLTTYQAELRALDAEIVEILSAVPDDRRVLVTNHEALGSFADRYGFEVVGAVVAAPSTLTESSPGHLEALAEAIEANGAPAIFVEQEHSSAEAEVLAERIGDVSVRQLHTEGLGEPGSGADTYTGLLRSNAQVIADALA
jgi:zinc/manganese transport system substrate-binding protein